MKPLLLKLLRWKFRVRLLLLEQEKILLFQRTKKLLCNHLQQKVYCLAVNGFLFCFLSLYNLISMKALTRLLLLLSLCAGLSSCLSDDEYMLDPQGPQSNSVSGGDVESISVSLPEWNLPEGEASTRMSYNTSTWKTGWSDGDTLGIYPSSGGQVEFPITEGIGTLSAAFNGGGWGLKTGVKYAAYYPYDIMNQFKTNKTLQMTYTGQVQKANDNATHLGAFDYMGSASSAAVNNNLNFQLKRQGVIARIRATVNTTATYTELELISDKGDIVTEAAMDVSGSAAATTPKVYASSIKLKLNNIYVSNGANLTAYMMLYPYKFATNGTSLRIRLKDTDGNYYMGKVSSTLYDEAANAVSHWISATMGAPAITNANLIAAANAELGSGNELTVSNGVAYISTNSSKIASIKSLNLAGYDDPDVGNEICYFTNLEKLYINSNPIKTLDLSKNVKLTYLSCGSCGLTELDLTNNHELEELSCAGNYLTSLDLRQNLKLTKLYCYSNKLTSLDVSGHKVLTYLDTGPQTELTSLDVYGCTALETLICYRNKLTSLDLSSNTSLTKLTAYGTQLTKIAGLANTKLETLTLGSSSANYINNTLESLDISNMSYLKTLNLTYNKKLKSLTGLTSHATLTTVNLTNCTALTTLECYSNTKLTSLNVSGCTALKYLYCYSNSALTTLNVSGCTAMTYLSCNSDKLSALDVTTLTNLTDLRCTGATQTFSSLDLSKNTKLRELRVYNNTSLTSLDLSKNTALTYVDAEDCALTSLNVSTCSNLQKLYCKNNQLTTANLKLPTSNTVLTTLTCYNNRLSTLNVSALTALNWTGLYCGLQKNSSGTEIYISVTGNDLMYDYFCNNNNTIPSYSSSSSYNYKVKYENLYFPAQN